MIDVLTIADQLFFPEGPVAMPDGSLIVCEIGGERLTAIDRDGNRFLVANIPGGPNGAALGPDGKLYVCNNGGMTFGTHPHLPITVPTGVPANYRGGSVQRVNVTTGTVETLHRDVGGRPLNAPNDIVFDHTGGFWFTDHGKVHPTYRDRGSVCYVSNSGTISQQLYPMDAPNGIGLSPDGKRLYVSESYTAMLWEFDVRAPGELFQRPGLMPHGGRLLYRAPGLRYFDSLAVRPNGVIVVATIGDGGLTFISPTGNLQAFVATPDIFTTNICFGCLDSTIAYVTLSGTGRLASIRFDEERFIPPETP